MTREIGMQGEELVAQVLLARGYKILARNYRTRGGEIDIIARREGVIHFIEVKTRTRGTEDYGRPSEAVNGEKQRRIRSAAQYYFMRHEQTVACSMDVAEVEVHLLENSF